MKRLLILALIALPLLARTRYVDYVSGSDSNAGTSTASPWKHAPGMQGKTPAGAATGDGCAANCAAFTPAAGDQIILKGGVVWPYTVAPWDMQGWSGTSTTSTFGCTGTGCIYVGNAVGAGLSAWNAGKAAAITIDRDYGGWTSAPSVSCTGGGGSGVTATTTIMPTTATTSPTGTEKNIAGHLLSVVVTDGGSGYTSAPTCTLSGGGGSAVLVTSIDYATMDLGMSSGIIWHFGDYPTYSVYNPGFYIGAYTRASGVEVRNAMMYETPPSGIESALFGVFGNHSTGDNMFVHNMGVSCAGDGVCNNWGTIPDPVLHNNTEWLALLYGAYTELSNSNVNNGEFIYIGTAASRANYVCLADQVCTFGTGIGTGGGGTYPASIHHNRSFANAWLIRAYGGVASSSDYPYLIYNNDVWLAMAVINPTAHINRMYSNVSSANPPAVLFFNNYDHSHFSGSSNQMGCQQGTQYWFFNNVSFAAGTGTDVSFGLEDGASGNGACVTNAYNNTWYDTFVNECVNGANMPQATTAKLQNNQCLSAAAANPFYGNAANLTFTNHAGSGVQADVQAANVEQAYGISGYSVSNFLAPTSGSAGTVTFSASGGTANLTSLCATSVKGFSLAPLCADINGVARPTVGGWQAGAYQYAGDPTTPIITTASLPNAALTAAYSHPLTATGTTPITYAIIAGALPSGMSMSSGGVFSGTPTVRGDFFITVRATNADGTGDRSYILRVKPNPNANGAKPAAIILNMR